MKKTLLSTFVIFCLAGYHSYAQIKWDAEKFMPLSEVKQGMKGKGYTVFFGTTVEEFEYKVVSIEYNLYPGWHVVWVEGLSDNFKSTGVAVGMSGSPMYINGRLMGAISLGYSNEREDSNICGVTPFELMVKVTQRGMTPNLSYEGTQLFSLGSTDARQDDGLDMGLSVLRDGKIAHAPRISDATLQVRTAQLPLPITFPNLRSDLMQVVQPILEKFNFIPVQAAGGGSPKKESPVEGGQIVGTELMRGDVSFFGYGTITYVDGNELLAYGHPGLGEGNINLPMSGGYVHFIFPSRSRSFKVASPTQPIGTFVQDREPAVAGIIGKHPSYLPVNVTVQTTDGKQHNRYYEVARHRSFSPLYTGIGVSSIIDALEFYRNDYTLNLGATLTLKAHPDLKTRKLVYKNTYSSSSSPSSEVMQTLMLPLLQLGINPYTKVQVESVTLDLKIGDKRRTARIQGLQMDKLRYRPGDTVEVDITLQPYFEKPIVQIGTITIPKDAPEGLVTLLATDASFHESWQRNRAQLNFHHKNINQFVELLQRGENNSDIIMELFVPEPGLTVEGEEFESLPPSVLSVMNTATQSGKSGYTAGTTLHIDRVSTDYVISGSGIIRLVVDRNSE